MEKEAFFFFFFFASTICRMLSFHGTVNAQQTDASVFRKKLNRQDFDSAKCMFDSVPSLFGSLKSERALANSAALVFCLGEWRRKGELKIRIQDTWSQLSKDVAP